MVSLARAVLREVSRPRPPPPARCCYHRPVGRASIRLGPRLRAHRLRPQVSVLSRCENHDNVVKCSPPRPIAPIRAAPRPAAPRRAAPTRWRHQPRSRVRKCTLVRYNNAWAELVTERKTARGDDEDEDEDEEEDEDEDEDEDEEDEEDEEEDSTSSGVLVSPFSLASSHDLPAPGHPPAQRADGREADASSGNPGRGAGGEASGLRRMKRLVSRAMEVMVEEVARDDQTTGRTVLQTVSSIEREVVPASRPEPATPAGGRVGAQV